MTYTYLAFEPWLFRFLWWTRALVKFCLIVWWHVWCDLGLDSTQLCSFTEAVTFNCKTTQQKGAELWGWNCTSKENELEHFRVRILISNYLSVDWQEFIPSWEFRKFIRKGAAYLPFRHDFLCLSPKISNNLQIWPCFFLCPRCHRFGDFSFPSLLRPSKQHGKRRIPRVWALTSSNPWSTCKQKPINKSTEPNVYPSQVIQAVTFSSPNVGGHQQPLKRALNHPQKVTLNHQVPKTNIF